MRGETGIGFGRPGEAAVGTGRVYRRSTIRLDRLARIAAIALYFLVAFEPFVALRPLPGSLSWGLAPIAALGALVTADRQQLRRAVVDPLIVGLASWSAASLAWTTSFEEGFFAWRSQFPVLIVVVALFGAMPPAVSVRALTATIISIAAWSTLISMVWPPASATIIGQAPNIDLVHGWRGTFVHKNLMGAFCVMGLGLVLTTTRLRSAKIAAVLLLTVAIVGSRSATAGAGMFATLGVWSWMTWIGHIRHPTTKLIAKVGSLAAAAFAGIASVATVPLFLDLYGKDMTLSGRTEIWTASVRMISQSPWIGHGLGSIWLDRTNPLTQRLVREIGFDAAHAHNGLLDVLLATGVVGLVLVIGIFASVIRVGIIALRHPSTSAFGRWAIVSAVGLFVMSISEPLLQPPFLGLLVIVGAVTQRSITDRRMAPTAHRSSNVVPALEVEQWSASRRTMGTSHR